VLILYLEEFIFFKLLVIYLGKKDVANQVLWSSFCCPYFPSRIVCRPWPTFWIEFSCFVFFFMLV
jgi:hypothetical protein